jgi:hypothetical protein
LRQRRIRWRSLARWQIKMKSLQGQSLSAAPNGKHGFSNRFYRAIVLLRPPNALTSVCHAPKQTAGLHNLRPPCRTRRERESLSWNAHLWFPEETMGRLKASTEALTSGPLLIHTSGASFGGQGNWPPLRLPNPSLDTGGMKILRLLRVDVGSPMADFSPTVLPA